MSLIAHVHRLRIVYSLLTIAAPILVCHDMVKPDVGGQRTKSGHAHTGEHRHLRDDQPVDERG
jgi:hypothetical protein